MVSFFTASNKIYDESWSLRKMMPPEHMLWGFIFSLGAYIAFPYIGLTGIFIIFLSSIFIDVDHYFASVIAGRGWSVSGAYKWYTTPDRNVKDHVEKGFIPFHCLEFFALEGLVIFILFHLTYTGIIDNSFLKMLWAFLFCNLLGSAFHLALDLGVMIYEHDNPYVKVSIIYTYFLNKSLLRNENIKKTRKNISKN